MPEAATGRLVATSSRGRPFHEAPWELGVLTLASPLLRGCCVMTLGMTLCSLAQLPRLGRTWTPAPVGSLPTIPLSLS